MASPSGLLSAGEEIAPGYRVIGLLRRGALLDVYDCWSTLRQCRCVLKVGRTSDPRTQRRLLREGRLLRRLVHPHMVRVYDVLTEPRPALVLETLTGATLSHQIHATPRGLGAADVAALGLHLCSAVQYLHANRILHLDLKPSNIIVDGGVARILDLEIARSPGRGRGEGTRQYMAPEQVQSAALGPKTDVWGLGMVLFEAATGRLPFDFSVATAYPQIAAQAESVRRCRPRLSRALVCAIDSALEPDPSRRPTVDELAIMLSTLVEDAPAWRQA
jgi:serine/threonine protein kinase